MLSGEPKASPRVVSRFEASLLRILRFFFRQAPAEEALPLVRANVNRPPCLSPAAVHLVRDTLSKGCVLYLVRAGGWKHERFLRSGEPKAGRLWQRGSLDDLKLEFSRHSLEFLLWLTSAAPADTKRLAPAPADELTIADQLLFFLAYQALRDEQDIAAAFRGLRLFTGNALCRLFYSCDFAEDEKLEAAAFVPWLSGSGGFILEALQSILEARWLEIEHAKGQLGDWEQMRRQGMAELAVLGVFLDAAGQTGRPDLTRFLLAALARLLATPDMTPAFWTGGLQGSGPTRLADRLEVQRCALSMLRQAERLGEAERRARASGYFDDDYVQSKFWLGEWERLNGSQTTERAERIVQMLEPLRPNN